MSNKDDSDQTMWYQIMWCPIDMRTWDEMLNDALKENGESYNDVIYTSHPRHENLFWFGRPLDGYDPQGFVVITKRYIYRPYRAIVERLIKPQMPKNIMLSSGEPDLSCDWPKTRRVETWDIVSAPLPIDFQIYLDETYGRGKSVAADDKMEELDSTKQGSERHGNNMRTQKQ